MLTRVLLIENFIGAAVGITATVAAAAGQE